MILCRKPIFPQSLTFWLSSLVILCGGCHNMSQENASDLTKKQYEVERNRVEVMELKQTVFEKQLVSNGRLRAHEKSILSFKTPGQIAYIGVENGSIVKQGELLARLEDDELRSAVEKAEQNLEKSNIDFQDVLIGFGQNAKDTVGVSREMLHMAAIRSGYLAAQTALSDAQRDLANAQLRAPFTGKVADIASQLHEQSKDQFCTLIDDRMLEVDFSILETELSFVWRGQSVSVSPLNNPNLFLPGKITQINPTVDKNGQIQLRAQVTNNGSLLDGMNVRVLVEQKVPDQLVVPKSAVVIRDNLEVLFCFSEGKARWVYVNTVMSNNDSYVVKPNASRGGELSVGDSVIVSGNLNLAEGSLVELMPLE